MNNKYLYLVLAAIVSVLAYYVGQMAYFGGSAGSLSNDYWYALIIAVALGAGNTGGDDAISILVASVTEYIPTMINIAIFAIVMNLVYGMGIMGGAFDLQGTIAMAVTYVVSATFANAVFSYLKKA